jgi:hypothetical protein
MLYERFTVNFPLLLNRFGGSGTVLPGASRGQGLVDVAVVVAVVVWAKAKIGISASSTASPISLDRFSRHSLVLTQGVFMSRPL